VSIRSVNPRTGAAFGPEFVDTTKSEMEAVLDAAVASARPWAATARVVRAQALEAIADRLDADGDALAELADAETALGAARLSGEVSRTTYQLRMFASLLRSADVSWDMHDEAVAGAPPAGRPDLRRVLAPLGPVAVFAASNFPFAFSVAGGDTASALAAGCPVIVKAHPAHPQTSAAVGAHVRAALDRTDAPAGTFAVVHGFEAGRGLVLDSRVRAAAFTGSYEGGRALFDLAAGRPDPIPFYGELGSVNPVLVTPGGARRSAELAAGYVESLTLGAGQFCTNPGLLLAPRDTVLDAVAAAAAQARGGTFLYEGIASRFEERAASLSKVEGVRVVYRGAAGSGLSAPVVIMATDAESALANAGALQAECFGPAGIVVEYNDPDDALAFVDQLHGCLVATVHGDESEPLAAQFVSAAARVAGRVVWNGWPTGVAVSPAQHHGGPFPSTTNALHTSVGATAVYRFLRPIAFQNMPSRLMPDVVRAQVLTEQDAVGDR